MRHIDLTSIRLGDIELFMTVAELKSFTKAANSLHHTQSYVSKHISELERSFGLRLFFRNGKTITLTPAGQTLYHGWAGISNQVMRTLQEAHISQQGFSRHIRFGCIDWMNLEYIGKIKKLADMNTDLEITVQELDFRSLREKFVSGNLDAVLTINYGSEWDTVKNTSSKLLEKGHLVALVHENHHLAGRECISMADLRNESFLMRNDADAPSYVSTILELCEKEDFTPRITEYVDSGRSCILNVVMDKGITIVTNFYIGEHDHEFFKSVPIAGTTASMILVWRTDSKVKNLDELMMQL